MNVRLISCLPWCLVMFNWLTMAAADDRHLSPAKNGQTRTVESDLNVLVLEGPELHSSLVTRRMDESIRHLPAGLVPPKNPHISTDAEFVRAIARAGSQGRLKEDAVRAVLYALYVGEHELGFYGMEADSIADAGRREAQLREIWALNSRLDRARVHRKGLVLLVVWTDGVSSECWQSVNAKVIERLDAITTLLDKR